MAFDDREVTYGDVTFHIGKLLPEESKQVFMTHVRPLLEGALSANTEGESGMFLSMVIGVISKAPQQHIDALENVLFQQVTYTSPNQATPVRLSGDTALAFKDLEGVHILLVLGRACIVNFQGWWDVLQLEFPPLNRAIAQLRSPT